jgi:hypothetical protein
VLRCVPRTQQRVPAERLNRGFFTGENHKKAIPIYSGDTFQPPAERWRWTAAINIPSFVI